MKENEKEGFFCGVDSVGRANAFRFLNFNALCFVIHHSNRGISIVPKVPFFLTNGFSRNVPVCGMLRTMF